MAAKKTSKKKTSKKTTDRPAPAKKKPAAKRVRTKTNRSAAKEKTAATPKTTAKKKRDTRPRSTTSKTAKSSTKSQAAAEVAERVLSGEDERGVAGLGEDLVSGKTSVAAQAARVLDEIVDRKPEAVVSVIDQYVKVIGASAKRPAQSAAHALPVMARVAPARVARHLPRLKDAFEGATGVGKDGLIRTFAGLCTASVAYQKRLEEVLNRGLREADAKTLIQWTEVVLPALKGEPHARARATVEARLDRIPKVHAQKIADFLGIKLRLRYR